jgi:GT2 family glycosyltransferase
MVTIGIWYYADPAGLEHTLASIRKHTGSPYRLVVLGDGCQATADALPKCAHLDSARPLGAAACFNRLIAHDDADVVVFLESGSIVTPDWLDQLLEAMQVDSDHGLAGPSTNRAWNAQRHRRDYCGHCSGEACAYFAPRKLIQIRLPTGGIDDQTHHRLEWINGQRQVSVPPSIPHHPPPGEYEPETHY